MNHFFFGKNKLVVKEKEVITDIEMI